ncbi:hypothetical protein KSF_097960 [Reticulibacter mediterranei]|uniref:Uncharacterized protein n=1 Tax=Reticulibacter mediterranei TaxID=2778369 RepID=A0A8J3IWE5_9CHLR|nr:hypothetical protein KSF_097960 [Reticulibacter mediterranei]
MCKKQFPRPHSDKHTSGIGVARNELIWFIDSNGDSVLFFDPASQRFATYKLAANAHPHDGLQVSDNTISFPKEFENEAESVL